MMNASPRRIPLSAGNCGRCGHRHDRDQCPAWRARCRRCSYRGHFARLCYTTLGRQTHAQGQHMVTSNRYKSQGRRNRDQRRLQAFLHNKLQRQQLAVIDAAAVTPQITVSTQTQPFVSQSSNVPSWYCEATYENERQSLLNDLAQRTDQIITLEHVLDRQKDQIATLELQIEQMQSKSEQQIAALEQQLEERQIQLQQQVAALEVEQNSYESKEVCKSCDDVNDILLTTAEYIYDREMDMNDPKLDNPFGVFVDFADKHRAMERDYRALQQAQNESQQRLAIVKQKLDPSLSQPQHQIATLELEVVQNSLKYHELEQVCDNLRSMISSAEAYIEEQDLDGSCGHTHDPDDPVTVVVNRARFLDRRHHYLEAEIRYLRHLNDIPQKF